MDLSPGSNIRELINNEFQHDRYSQFREWYFKKFSSPELNRFKEDYYEELTMTQNYVPFVKWFITYFINKINAEVLVLQSKYWETVRGETISSPFPPKQVISLGQNTKASAFLSLQKIEHNQVTIRELNSIIRSQNYTNTFLICLGDQFASLERDLTSLGELFEK